MLYRKLSLFFTLIFTLTFSQALLQANSVFAQQADPQQTDPMIIIGGGAMNSSKTLEALFRIEGNGIINKADGAYFVVARIRTDMLLSKDPSYFDLHLDGIGFGQKTDDLFSKAYWDVTLFNLDIQKNIATNLGQNIRVTFVGLRAGLESEITENVKFLINGAADMLGFGFSERLSDRNGSSGAGLGLSLEAGFKFAEKYRITLSHKSNLNESDPVRYYNGISCSTYYHDDPYYGSGWAETYCGPSYSTRYTQSRNYHQTALNITADIFKNFAAFGKVAYNVYSVSSDFGQVPGSRDFAWQFLWGVTYKF